MTTIAKIFILIALLSFSKHSFSQKHTNYWYFGKKVGLNFNQTPPQVLFNNVASTIEGSAAISDNNGNLLFYTNGDVIMNKNHLKMKNGEDIMGNVSSTNNALIVPLPESNGLYYLFTVGAAGYSYEGFCYNIIDMTKENGLGEVVSKNNLLNEETYEKLAAVRHCNMKDVWIVIKPWNRDEYHAYLLNSSGLSSSPVISSTGLVIGGYINNSLGTLKFSPDGRKMVAIHSFENNKAELMEFNNATGVLSNPVVFSPNTTPVFGSWMGIYGAEFSPDSRLLYISSNNSDVASAILYQFDVTLMNATSIMNSRQIISQTSPWRGGGLQLGPDLKIYFTMWMDSSLSVIENPDVYGSGCNFQYHKILMSNTLSEPLQAGLPTFVAGDMDERYTPFDFSSVSDCISYDASFVLNKTTGVDSVLWNFGDGNLSTSLSPSHTYAAGGSYVVTLTVYTVSCSGNSEVIIRNVSLNSPSGNFLPVDTSLCEIKDLIIPANIGAQSYLWSTGESTDAITVSLPGEYWLEILKDGCISRDSITITESEPVSVNIGRDTTVCVSKPVTIYAGSHTNYSWNTGSVNSSIEITRPGLYIVSVENAAGCTASDSLLVTWGDCDVYIPNAFTPNGDGINDEFSLFNGINTESFSMQIYNRYGQLMFSSREPMNRWNGKFKGKDAPMGLYPWVIVYKKNGFVHTEKGTVMLIR